MMSGINKDTNSDSEYKKVTREFFHSNWFGYLSAFIVALINIHFYYIEDESSVLKKIIALDVSKLFGNDSELYRIHVSSILISIIVVAICSFIVQIHVNSILKKYINDDSENNIVNSVLRIINSGYNTETLYPSGKLDFIRKKLALIYSASMTCAVFLILSPIYIYKSNYTDLTVCLFAIILFGYFIRKFTVVYIENYVVLSLISFSKKNELYRIIENRNLFFNEI